MYNAESWIRRCIESILDQTFHELEIIVINDGSIDNSLNIVKDCCRMDDRVQCISTENQGSAAAKNVGLKHISGNIVTFVDADDFIEAEMYETMITTMNDTDADIVECACRKINRYGRILNNIELVDEEIEGNEKCILHFIRQKNAQNYMCNKIYRSKLFEGTCFPPLYFSEDYYMNVILHSRISKKIVISQTFYNYMLHPGQSTDKGNMNIKKIDGIKAGNMVADFFSYNKKLKNYAGLYACNYALDMADIMVGLDNRMVKKIIKKMKPELFRALSHISFDMLQNKNEKRVIYQCLLMLIANSNFYAFRWLLK